MRGPVLPTPPGVPGVSLCSGVAVVGLGMSVFSSFMTSPLLTLSGGQLVPFAGSICLFICNASPSAFSACVCVCVCESGGPSVAEAPVHEPFVSFPWLSGRSPPLSRLLE